MKNLYEILFFMIGSAIVLFIIASVAAAILRPTDPSNVEMRKEIIDIINFLAGTLAGILANRLNKSNTNE